MSRVEATENEKHSQWVVVNHKTTILSIRVYPYCNLIIIVLAVPAMHKTTTLSTVKNYNADS